MPVTYGNFSSGPARNPPPLKAPRPADIWTTTCGHPVGDHVLRTLASRLSSGTRAEDIIARYGGEEFAVVCRQTDATHAFGLAERLRVLVAEAPFIQGGLTVPVTVSIGIAATPAEGIASELDLVRRSDSALYKAKGRGRNCSVVFAAR